MVKKKESYIDWYLREVQPHKTEYDELAFERRFNAFIMKWCGDSKHHLLDTDENDGEELRHYVEDNYTQNEKLKKAIELTTHPTGTNSKVCIVEELLKELNLNTSLFGMEIKTDDTLKENEMRLE